MKKINLQFLMFLTLSLLLSSCLKDEETTAKPQINLTELGYDNSGIAYAGSELHIEAEIIAEGRIDIVAIEIHPENEHQKQSSYLMQQHEWEMDTIYKAFSGLKNATFHKHITIPMDADTGDYHFHFLVSDQKGQQSVAARELSIKLPVDDILPVIQINNSPAADQVFNQGETISISGMVSDDQALGGMYVGLVRTDQNLSDDAIDATNTITLLHSHNFEGQTTYNFTASITVGAEYDNNTDPKPITGDLAWQTADYYLLVKVTDAYGSNRACSGHFPIQIIY